MLDEVNFFNGRSSRSSKSSSITSRLKTVKATIYSAQGSTTDNLGKLFIKQSVRNLLLFFNLHTYAFIYIYIPTCTHTRIYVHTQV